MTNFGDRPASDETTTTTTTTTTTAAATIEEKGDELVDVDLGSQSSGGEEEEEGEREAKVGRTVDADDESEDEGEGEKEKEDDGSGLWGSGSRVSLDSVEEGSSDPAPQDSAELKRRLETIRRALRAGPDQSWTGLYPTLKSGWDDKEINDLREIKVKLVAGSGTALAGVVTASVLAWANFWKAEAAGEKSEDPAGEEKTSTGLASAYIVGGSMAAFGGGFFAYNEARKYYSLVRTHNTRLLKDHLKKIEDNTVALAGIEDVFLEAQVDLDDDVADLLETTRKELAEAKARTEELINTRKSEAYKLDELAKVEKELMEQRDGLLKRAKDHKDKKPQHGDDNGSEDGEGDGDEH